MYHSRIEAEIAIDRRVPAAAERESAGAMVLGIVVLLIGLPLLAARLFAAALARDAGRLLKLAGICGRAAIEAARKPV